MENKKISGFQIILIIITVVLAGGALAFGFLQKKSFDNNAKAYQSKSGELRKIKSMAGYPSQETVDKMSESLKDYELTLGELNKGFEVVTIPKFENVSPAAFSSKVSKATERIKGLYSEKGISLPDDWYLGFEKYTSVPAPKEATGILLYKLEAIVWLHEQLLECEPEALLNLYRKPVGLEVEGGESVASNKSANKKKDKRNVVSLPIELTFIAAEKNARNFINVVSKMDKYAFTIDSVTLKEVKVTDSLEMKEESKKREAPKDDEFDSLFNEEDTEEVVMSDEKIFTQVLGKERVAVFMDLNLTYLPKPIEVAKK